MLKFLKMFHDLVIINPNCRPVGNKS